MTALLRLYPRSWRDRYGDEMERLIEDRPLDLLGTIDLLRGAVDARLHPSMVPVTIGGAPGLPSNATAARRPFAAGPFLGTFAAGLLLISAELLAAQSQLPLWIASEMAGAFVAFSSLVLGLAVLAMTRNGVVTRLAGLVFAAGIVTLPMTGLWVPSVLTLVVGGLLLALGSVVDGQPSRAIGGVAFGLAIALWVSYQAGTWLAAVIATFAIVPVALAIAHPGKLRPIVIGVVATALTAAVIVVGTYATSPVLVHDGFAVRCGETATGECLGEIDSLANRFHAMRPSDIIVEGRVVEDGHAEICATVVVASGGQNPFDDPNEVARLQASSRFGLSYAGGAANAAGEVTQTCWQAA
jgi:hypothetical protein